MEIHGIQKMTLLDYPEKVACTIFTARCNFRCPFCHNASLVTHVDAAAAISEEEVFSFLAKRQGASASAGYRRVYPESERARLSGQAGYQRQQCIASESAGGTGACGLCSNGYQKCSG